MVTWLHDRRRHSSPPTTDHKTFSDPTGAAQVTLDHTSSSWEYVLRASGEFDLETVGCLQLALHAVPQTPAGRTVIDVSGVTFGDSSFLHVLIGAHFQQNRLTIAGPLPTELRRLFELTGTLRMFDIVPHYALKQPDHRSSGVREPRGEA
ncbi:STAS domain-containing protein [Streptomyces sp. NPDC046712]|uniref:STAS domain-containing protein n=1 Tax=Streptomyces sp. NPDC046712 TaxID=3154802 RepID=UPI0033DF5F45